MHCRIHASTSLSTQALARAPSLTGSGNFPSLIKR